MPIAAAPRATATPFRRWLRRLTAWAIFGSLAAATVVAVSRGRTIRPGATLEPPADVAPPESGDAGETTAEYRGFRFVETVAGQLIFALTSVRTLGTSSGWHEIQDVQLELYQQGRASGVLTCDSAAFNIQTHDTRLDGGIQLRLPDGAVIRTERGHFEGETRELVTGAETVFMSPTAIGRAGRARYSVAEDRLLLEEGVDLRSRQGGRLVAARVVYERQTGTVRLPDGYRLTFGESTVTGPSGLVRLDGNDGPPRQLELEGGVSLEGARDTTGLTGWAERLTASRDAGGSWQFQASTTSRWVTLVARDPAAYYERSIAAWALRGAAGSAGLLTVIAEGGTCLHEVPLEGDIRTAEAASTQVWFEEQQPTTVELEGNVVVAGDGLRGRGARARLAGKGGLLLLHADPTGRQRAVLVGPRGTISADQVRVLQVERRAEARGSVQGELTGASLMARGPLASGSDEPVHFAADHLTAVEEGGSYHLKGSARAWQGERLLQGDEIRLSQAEQTLHALGHVRTVLPEGEVAGSSAAGGGEATVLARSLDYDGVARVAVYRGDVSFTDSVRVMRAAQLRLVFDEANQVSSVEATGGVEIVEVATRRRMTGRQAVRDTASRTVTVRGAPVQLTDEKGNAVSGAELVWEEASGRVQVSGAADAPTDTIYYPEEGAEPGFPAGPSRPRDPGRVPPQEAP